MKCPKLVHHRPIPAGWEEAFFGDCLKEECAFWNTTLNQCDPTGLIPVLLKIEECLELIVKKMPHEEQFRK